MDFPQLRTLNLTVSPSAKEPIENPPDPEMVRQALQNPALRAHISLMLSVFLQQRALLKFNVPNLQEVILEDAFKQGQFDALTQLYLLGE